MKIITIIMKMIIIAVGIDNEDIEEDGKYRV